MEERKKDKSEEGLLTLAVSQAICVTMFHVLLKGRSAGNRDIMVSGGKQARLCGLAAPNKVTKLKGKLLHKQPQTQQTLCSQCVYAAESAILEPNQRTTISCPGGLKISGYEEHRQASRYIAGTGITASSADTKRFMFYLAAIKTSCYNLCRIAIKKYLLAPLPFGLI